MQATLWLQTSLMTDQFLALTSVKKTRYVEAVRLFAQCRLIIGKDWYPGKRTEIKHPAIVCVFLRQLMRAKQPCPEETSACCHVPLLSPLRTWSHLSFASSSSLSSPSPL
ncbi:hypothetical protein MATL_G00179000 [Megalops atlanticus]|uniref:Uncharacterized protein n=1 Tax=Megalops atlanticus TaxID=7932 RepID=A0A9D3PM24_MEGAT|nr:hypothetical protein MATL_G00179000 [Megalops atlanticus]